MNNRGFAITTILFGLLILFMLLFVSLLGILSTYRSNLEKLVDNTNGARDILNRDYIKPKPNRWSNMTIASSSETISSATTTICNLSESNIVSLSEMEYYVTGTTGTITASLSSPKIATINNNCAEININPITEATLHYRLKSKTDKLSNWVSQSNIAEYILIGEVYNWLLYEDGSAANLDSVNIGSWINNQTSVKNKVSGIVNSEEGSTVRNKYNNDSDAYTKILYRGILGRDASSTDLSSWNSTSNDDKVNAILNSDEFSNILTTWGLS